LRGGVASAVDAVTQGALPPDRFKFFYKTVEWLPGALRMQLDAGIFRLVELSPAYLYGQYGHRSMWKDVLKNLKEEDADSAVVVDEANVVAAPVGLPYEAGGLAEEASRGAAQLRLEKEKALEARQAVADEAKRKSLEAKNAHDAKVRALVDRIKQEKAAGAAGAAQASPAEAPPASAVASVAGAQGVPSPASAEKAAAWLAEQGIVPPEKEAAEETQTRLAVKESTDGSGASAIGIEMLVGYRFHLGNEQWRVRWAGEGEGADTWEVWRVIDTPELRRDAERLRADAQSP